MFRQERRFMTFVIKGYKPLSQQDIQRRLVAYPQLQQSGAFEKWLRETPQIDATPRVEEKKECSSLRAAGRTPAVLFSRRLPPGREHQTMLSVHTQRIHDITVREGFTGRAYWLNVEGRQERVLVRPHQVQLEGDTSRPSNLTFCLIDEKELNEDIERTSSLLPLALAALSSQSGPKSKRD